MSTEVDPYKALPSQGINKTCIISSTEPFTPRYLKSCLTQSADPAGIYSNRIQGRKIHLDNPPRESKARKERQEKQSRRQKHQAKKAIGVIGRKEAKEKCVWHFEDTQARFELFLPLHHFWLDYMSELLGLSQPPSSPGALPTARDVPAATGMHAKLVKADFHGSIITVRQSKNPSLIGLSGIIIHETENAFRIITQNDRVKLLPKQGSIFAFAVPLYSTLSGDDIMQTQASAPTSSLTSERKTTVLMAPHIEFELYGNQFRFRAAERAGRKFKHKETIEL